MPVYPNPALAQSDAPEHAIRTISTADVFDALGRGVSDFWRHPSHYLFLALIYPAVGIVLAVWSAGGATFPLLYPLATGFALIGPLAAVGLYELSRRREQGEDDSPRHAFAVLKHRSIGAIVAVGAMLALVFVLWLTAAGAIYDAHFASSPPAGLMALLSETFTTARGWSLLFWGNLVGLGFAFFVLATTAIAFPLLVDRGGSAGDAVVVSVRAFATNPLQLTIFGLVVAIVLFAASLPLFVGLAIALPMLGHATWHLYRKLVV
ncbi:DUF2189 domain-containing protein [Pelagibacterium flavum]|uniref:DUF2189 domain-containing protein n=1 Tax=Pelagibacterium flavum TaxID=2984530 RepID=A0ABY6IR37_9HYPH|nr:DUF2189 domain-containing protein [Pelagibacterium sp. YIM 151497]UYQ73071.1 DUF2189 domain-containing protein [Pelagibacterium sp. YIM 151497]|eukprot:jgi/Tetstr1/451525/TSEL_038561.t1